MVIDTSAIGAIPAEEPEQREPAQVIEQAEVRLLSAATWVETSTVIERRYGPAGLHHLDRLLAQAGFETVAVDGEQARIAREAFQRFGKERHTAGLNFGDCFSYALAIDRSEALLFKGEDFVHTDVAVAQPVEMT